MRGVDKLYEINKDTEKKLNAIRAACKHDQGYHVEKYSWRPAAYMITRLCSICDEVLPEPVSEEDVEKFYKDNPTWAEIDRGDYGTDWKKNVVTIDQTSPTKEG